MRPGRRLLNRRQRSECGRHWHESSPNGCCWGADLGATAVWIVEPASPVPPVRCSRTAAAVPPVWLHPPPEKRTFPDITAQRTLRKRPAKRRVPQARRGRFRRNDLRIGGEPHANLVCAIVFGRGEVRMGSSGRRDQLTPKFSSPLRRLPLPSKFLSTVSLLVSLAAVVGLVLVVRACR
jgi:hypothetical protein